MSDDRAPITELLVAASEGDSEAMEEVVPLVYEELRQRAHARLGREWNGHGLQTTSLVHEAYLRLVDQRARWKNRAHFFALASTVMRRVLVDAARRRNRDKRGGGHAPISLTAVSDLGVEAEAVGLVELDETLARLESFSERGCRVVECRVFGGLSIEETAAALAVSPMTVKREWRAAKTWLRRELG